MNHTLNSRFPGLNLAAVTRLFLPAAVLVLGSIPQLAAADDWPFFRGPSNNGLSTESGWRTDWPPSGPTVAWHAAVGIGVSSFAVVGNRVLTMGSQNDSDIVWCLDAATGRVLWQFRYPCKFDDRNFDGGTASTPTVDEGRVFTLGYDGQLHALSLAEGRPLWISAGATRAGNMPDPLWW
jgi:outer membrane protein assembly factor BamB